MIDPYRTLGLAPGASVAEIKRAYRRLAKEHHPDSAGPGALPRFLAIQAAYEMLVEGRPGAPGSTSGRSGTAPGPAWQADPSRARATRDAWRRSRGDQARQASPGREDQGQQASPRRGTAGRESGPAGESPGPRGSATSEGRGSGPGQRSRRRSDHGPRRATPGSTSYDDAAHEPFEPDWSGGSWYGESSGTYWTINPREYADPRKHGPEYLARARRAAGGAGDGSEPGDPDAPAGAEPNQPADDPIAAGATGGESEPSWTAARESGWAWSERARDTRRGAGATDAQRSGRATGSAWANASSGGISPGEVPGGRHAGAGGQSGAGGRAGSKAGAGAGDPASMRRAWAGPAAGSKGESRTGVGSIPASGPTIGSLVGLGELVDRIRHQPATVRLRLVLAVAAWPPIGLAFALLIGELTGCARFAATCSSTAEFSTLVLGAQVAILAVLLAAVPIARLAAFGSLAILLAALPIVALLTAAGATYDPEPGTASLLALLALAWLIGVVLGWRGPSRTMPP